MKKRTLKVLEGFFVVLGMITTWYFGLILSSELGPRIKEKLSK